MDNKTFCAIPFLGVMVDTNQKIRYCCMTTGKLSGINIDGKPALASKVKLMDAWNSEEVKDVRRKMANGETVPACESCYFQESMGKTSNRQHSIIEWNGKLGKDKLDELIKEVIENDFASPNTPVYLDLRLGNLCNLKCRMCNPWNSSQIAKEHFDLFENNTEYKAIWTKHAGSNPTYLTEENDWYESNFLWEEIESFLPHLKKVYLTGGEPTLIEGNFRFMQTCIDKGYADKVVLFFNINCTNINSRFLNLIKQFKKVDINASVDGVGATNDYIRYPSKWSQIEKTLNQLAALPNVELNITPTLVLYNALECDKIILFAKELSIKHNRRIGIDYSFNRGNDSLNANIIDLAHRLPVIERLKALLNDPWVTNVRLTKNAVEALIGILSTDADLNTPELLKLFKQLTEIYDTSREQSFKDTFPELYQIIYEAP